SITPTRPVLSRKAMSFSPSSRSHIGAPSAASSEESAAGIQYCRMNSPITVPGPTRVRSSRSRALLTLASLDRSIAVFLKSSSGYAAELFGYGPSFLVLGAVGLVGLALFYGWLPETRPAKRA